MSRKPFVVVGCSGCNSRWIVERLRDQKTTACPSCGTTHQTKRLRVQARAETEEGARELRSRILTADTSYDVDPDSVGYFATENQVDDLYDRFNRYYEEEVEASLERHRQKYAKAAERAFEDWDNLFADQLTDGPTEHDQKYEGLVEGMLREFEATDETVTKSGNGSITVTEQVPVAAVTDVAVGDQSPTEFWQTLKESWSFFESIIESIRVSAAGKRPYEYREELTSRPLPPTYHELAVRIARGDRRAVRQLYDDLRTLGTGTSPTEDIESALALLGTDGDDDDGTDEAPVIAIRITEAFFERRADQRRGICELIATLARGCDVRLVAGRITRRKLVTKHREDLPGVSDQCSTHRDRPSTEATVEAALDAIEYDAPEVSVLRMLCEEPSKRLSYHAITSESQFGTSRTRQIAKTLNDLDLIDTFNVSGKGHMEILSAGSAFIDGLDAEYGQQSELFDCVSATGKPCYNSRVNPAPTRGGETATPERRTDGPVNPVWMDRWRHAAAAGCATDGGITLVDWKHPTDENRRPKSTERRQPYVSYDGDADRVVVGAEYDNPLAYWVSIARALASRQIFTDVLTEERLDGTDGDLAGLETDCPHILRNGTCLGWLRDMDASGKRYADRLRAAEEELCADLSRYARGDFEDERKFRGHLTRMALGLAGSMIHLLDLAGVDVVREMRVLQCSRQFSKPERREDLVETIARGVAIQSKLGHFAAYRQLYESDEKKRASAITPDVPADDPHGRLIGSFVIVGQGADRLEPDLREAIRGEIATLSTHEDAPEFDVGVPIRTYLGRQSFAQSIREALAGKHLSATNESVALMQALTNSPYDAAQAIGTGLADEEKYPGRDIRPDEVRTALSDLDSARILPDAPPSVSKMICALLTTSAPVTQTELAEMAGVSARSVRNHAGLLSEFGLVTITESGRFRLAISFSDERGPDAVLPNPVGRTSTSAADLLFDALPALVGDVVYNPDHPIGAAFLTGGGGPPVADRLVEADPSLEPWVDLALGLTGADEGLPETVYFGQTPSQAPLPTEVAV